MLVVFKVKAVQNGSLLLISRITMILNYFGRDICKVLPQFHAMTGCDTTCYRLRAGKVRIFQKFIKNKNNIKLLEDLGQRNELNEETVQTALCFIQTIIYNGDLQETFIQTRIRLYQLLEKNKNSTNSCRS